MTPMWGTPMSTRGCVYDVVESFQKVSLGQREWTIHRMESPRIDTVNTHGTGCTLSSAITSYLALRHPLPEACRLAKDYISAAIRDGAGYLIGHGHGPVNHFHSLWPKETF